MTDLSDPITFAGLTLMPPSGTTKSKRYWRVRGRLPDGREIDTTGGSTRESAEKKVYAIVAADSSFGAAGDQRPRSKTRYGNVLAEFVKPENHDSWGRNGGARHAGDIKSTLWNHVLPVLGTRPVGDLRPSDFRAILHQMRAEGYSPSTIKNVGGAMRATVTYMHNERYLDADYDPMRGVSYRARSITGATWVPYTDRPTVADKDRLADGVRFWAGDRWWIATHLAGLAGPRWGELIYLTPRHFDLERRQILIERQWNEHPTKQPGGVNAKGVPGGPFVEALPKNGTERVITYPAWLNPHLEALMAQVADEYEQRLSTGRRRNPLNLMFCTKEGTIPRRSSWNRDIITPARQYAEWPSETTQTVRYVDGRKVKQTGVSYRWTWHSLRHLFCSLAISNDEYGYGLDAVDAAKLAGHTLEVFMQKYVQAPANFTEHTARRMADVPAPIDKGVTGPAPHRPRRK